MREPPTIRHRERATPRAAPALDEAEAESPANYGVGYCRPPTHSRFKPGASGNPKGRPKGARGLKSLVRDLMIQRVPVRTATGITRLRRVEAVLLKSFELALKGNARAQSHLLGLYAAAVPEEVVDAVTAADDLTSTDLAALEELKRMMLRGEPEQ